MVSGFVKFVAAGVVAAGLFASPAAAAVLNIGTTGATLTCSVSCEGFTGAGGLNFDSPPPDNNQPTGVGTLSDSLAQLYAGQPASAADERNRLETLIGGPAGDLVFESGSDPDATFASNALYLVLKIGPKAIFIKNTSGAEQ